jgi:amino acid adenylation domain-containing protein
MADSSDEERIDGVAVIGLAGRFPGAGSVDELWENLKAGTESVRFFTDEELASSGVPDHLVRDPSYVKARGLISDPELFDAAFFGISPHEAELMDPQHRLFLETCWHGLENAGYAPASTKGQVGVWGGMSTGMSNDTYLHANLGGPSGVPEEDVLSAVLGNENDYLTSRVSYKLNLRGPSVNVQTACSTSLMAVVQAFQSLMTYGCDMAIAGGVSVSYPQKAGYLHQEGGIGSPDGHCRPFDADAQGTVFSNGVGVVVLKRVDEAVADGDTILAVIRGAAANNDGASKVSFAAPSVEGQADVIAMAQAVAGVEPASVTYIETHGTGTPIGDPIEVAALTRAFRRGTDEAGYCALGSIKSNIGHLDSAAGIAGFIKTVLCLHHGTLVPTVHFQTPSPEIEWENSPFFVSADTRSWHTERLPRRAGVSAFGIGGTNAHVVLEEAAPPSPADAASRAEPQALVLSARTGTALQQAVTDLADHLGGATHQRLADVAHTLQAGREHFHHRMALVASDALEARNVLVSNDRSRLVVGESDDIGDDCVFLFPGGGAHYVGMGRGLYDEMPGFRGAIDRGLDLLLEREGLDLRPIWFPAHGEEVAADEAFQKPSNQLPAIFILEMALADLLRGWGCEPTALIGHSMGENTAACLSGVLSYEDALGLVALRGRLFDTAAPGRMLSVASSPDALRPYLGPSLDLAAVNGPEQCTVSGPNDAIEALRVDLERAEIDAQVVPIDIAAHSHLVEPLLEPFEAYLSSVDLHPPTVPFLSNRSGTWITDAEATDPAYWAAHLRNTVRFADDVQAVLEDRRPFFLEVGPGRILGSLVKLADPTLAAQVAATMRHPLEPLADGNVLLEAMGRMWVAGADVDWDRIRGDEAVGRVPLPGYPFERRRFIIEPGNSIAPAAAASKDIVEPSPVADSSVAPMSPEPTPSAPAAPVASREERILARIRDIVHQFSGLDPAAIEPDRSFIEMGFDSLALTQANLRFRREFEVRVTFRQLFDEAPTPRALAAFLDGRMDPDALPAHGGAPAGASRVPAPVAQKATPGAAPEPDATRVGPYRSIKRTISAELSQAQDAYLEEFLSRYEERTRGSKVFTEEHRPHFADPRAVAGFKSALKEITYPIVAERSKGSKIWDVDGNEYVDLAGGFGATFFGHAPDFVMEAVRRQTEITVDYGPQSSLAPETARLVCEMTGMDRATFCNTGSEAVLAALRIARTVTGRDLIATFSGDYHGVFDEVLVKSRVMGGERKNFPAAPGIPGSSSQNLLVLDYGDPASLRVLEERADELAGVLIEPIQSRRPELQPKEFVQEVRRITRDADIPMIFDEIITGFRLHPQGAQAWYDVDSDIGCYGKVVGGGMPIGIVAGKARYMDALDGGPWQYGDDSFPEAGVTYFAGTFIRHPLAVAAVSAVLHRFREEGPELQAALNRRTAVFAEGINREYRRLGIPVEITYFGSVILPRFHGNGDFEGLYFHHLRHCGIHVWEGRPGFLSTAHDESDFSALHQGFVQAGTMMKEAGFFADSSLSPEEFEWTPAQSELWIAFQLGDDASAAYNEQIIFSVEDEVDEEVLRLTLDKVAHRHASLRSVARSDGRGLLALPYLAPEFDRVDLSQLSKNELSSRLDELLRDLVDRPFDFYRGPLFRARLVKTDPEQHLLALTVSHLICDGWSLEVVAQDIAHYYTAMTEGRQVARGVPPSVGDFIALVAEREQASDWDEARAHWLAVFDPLPEVAELPLDRARPILKTYNGERNSYTLAPVLATEVREYARSEGCTSFMVLLAAYKTLLHKLTGSRDLVVGIPAAGHPNLGMPDLVAHTVNYLPLRVGVDPTASFRELLGSVRDEFNGAKSYQDYAYGSLLRDLSVPRNPSRLPLLTASFNVDLEFAPLWFRDVQARFVATPRSRVKYDLHFNLLDKGSGLDLEVDHNSDILDRTTVEEWVAVYEQILREALLDPERSLDELGGRIPLPAEPSTEALIDVPASHPAFINAESPAEFPQTKALHARFEEVVAATPEAIAVECGAARWSYAELNRQANAIAHRLMEVGVGPGSSVGICAERSLDLIAGLVGILKTGACYVPLDPAYPPARLSAILEDASPSAILAESAVRVSLPASDTPVLPLGDGVDADGRSENPDVSVDPDDDAYVLFTSGSAGRPKGVAVTHRNVLRLVDGVQEWFQFGSDDVWSLFHSYAFDVSVFEMWGAFLHGGRLVVVPYLVSRDPTAFRALLAGTRVTVLSQTPSAFLQLQPADVREADRLPLRYVVFAGEALLPGSLLPWIEKHGSDGPELINMYGITETTVHVTYRPVTEEDVRSDAPSYIGVPIPDLSLYVLDTQARPVSVGDEGELYVGGAGVARGYVGRPELTAERFIENPFGPGRLYRSGDIVRLTDGDLEYRGRMDGQVQIRGFRVELGEVENALARSEGVSQAVAVVRTDGHGFSTLTGYFVPEEGMNIDQLELRNHLRAVLPEYMVPQHLISLDFFPLNENGKVDRRNLPAPSMTAPTPGPASQNGSEASRAVQSIWREVLKVSQAHPSDDFFDAGGHSLLATQLLALIDRDVGVRVPLRTLFEQPTLEALVSAVETMLESEPQHGD